ncbi:MAG TPA: tetratricopeptide repeat protein [Planctomycetota bacterium]|nr:tetratricopeptide repeat protein [Planctomycetota bacterium]
MTEVIQQRLERGVLLYQQDRFERALVEALAALAEDASDARAHALASCCHVQLGRAKEAEIAAREAVRCAPDMPFGWETLCDALFIQGRDIEAIEAIDCALDLDPERASSHVQRARSLRRQSRPVEAMQALQEAMELEPENTSALTLRAQILEEQHLDASASESTGDLLRLEAENAEAHALRGWIALRKRDLAVAEESLGESLRLDPHGSDARNGLVALHKLRHPLLRWLGPGWRAPRSSGDPGDEKEQARSEKSFGLFFKLSLFPAVLATKYLLAPADLATWAAWCIAAAGGFFAALILAAVLLGVWEVSRAFLREAPSLVGSLVHGLLIEPLGDLVLAASRSGRRVLPTGRLLFACSVWGAALILAAISLALFHFGAWALARSALAVLVFLPFLLGLWPGDARRWQLGLLPCALLLAVGIQAGSWGVGCASLALVFPAICWSGSFDAKSMRWLLANHVLTSAATLGLGVSTWLAHAPASWWSLCTAAVGCVSTFVMLATLSAPSPATLPKEFADSVPGKAPPS